MGVPDRLGGAVEDKITRKGDNKGHSRKRERQRQRHRGIPVTRKPTNGAGFERKAEAEVTQERGAGKIIKEPAGCQTLSCRQ